MKKIFAPENIKLAKTAYEASQFSKSRFSEFAFIGRSNVGKSSLINALSKSNCMAHISNKPGKTVSVNYFEVANKFYLVDLPGYGYAKLSKQMLNKLSHLIGDYFSTSTNLRVVFLLLDGRHEVKESDLEILNQLSTLNIEIFLVLTKCDKKEFKSKLWAGILSKLKDDFKNISGFIFSSSKSGKGIKEIEHEILNKID